MIKTLSIAAVAAAGAAFGVLPAGAEAWNGFYAGLHTGYTFGEVDQPYSDVGGPFIYTDQIAPDIDASIYGAQIGYNFTAGEKWVLGVELQGSWGGRKGDDEGTGGDVNGVDIRSEYSLRARGGYLVLPDTLLYATVGWVTMDVNASAPIQGAVGEPIDGWTWGIGGEWAFTERWSTALEIRHDEMNETRFSFPVDNYDEGLTPNTTSVRLAFNWHP